MRVIKNKANFLTRIKKNQVDNTYENKLTNINVKLSFQLNIL